MKDLIPEPKIKALIIDDDLASARLLADELTRRPDTELCAMATTLREGQRLVALHRPHLLFLDMEFPEGNGLAWYEENQLPACTRVVFHTCYQRYIHDALSLKVFDFLLKPFAPSELDVVINRYLNMNADSAVLRTHATGIPSSPLRHEKTKLISITSVTNSKIIVNPDDIVYFRYMSDRKIWECVFSNLKRIIMKRQTTDESILGYG